MILTRLWRLLQKRRRARRYRVESAESYARAIDEWIKWEDRARRAERLLTDQLTPKEIGRANHIADLEAKVATLKRTVREMQEQNERRKKALEGKP